MLHAVVLLLLDPRMVMHARTTACAALAAAGLLALPGVAGAAGGKQVYAGPLKVKGYQMNVMAADGAGGDSVMFLFSKFAGKSTQTHTYSFQKGVSVVVKGSKATIKGSLGAYGSVNLKLNATKRVGGVVPKGCTGKVGASKSGIAAGKLRLVVDKTYFRTVSAKRLKATIPGSANIKCDGEGGGGTGGKPAHGVSLFKSLAGDGGGRNVMLNASKGSSGTFEMASVMEQSPQVMVSHTITASAPASALTAADDLSSATLTAAGPFLSGTGRFAGELMGGMSMGALTGDFAAKFDSIGRVVLVDDEENAMLRKY
jgi:hypothetical protein